MGSLLGFAPFERLVGRNGVGYRVDVSSVANTQNHDLISLNVKYDTVVADPKSV